MPGYGTKRVTAKREEFSRELILFKEKTIPPPAQN
jgi:hypothetical protein